MLRRAVTRLLAPIALVLCLSTPASASGLDLAGSYGMPGIELGVTFVDVDDVGALVGFEVSVVELETDGLWMGVLLNTVYDTAVERARVIVGPEIGKAFGGIDGGIGLDSEGEFCGRLRGLLTVGVGSVYGGVLLGAGGPRGEVGILVKLPIEF